jgi:hypothetical protein
VPGDGEEDRLSGSVSNAGPTGTDRNWRYRANGLCDRRHWRGGIGRCARSWRGWVIGSTETGDHHLVITASPRPLQRYAEVVNGPAWYPQARVRPLAWVTINGWRMRAVYAPQSTNDGSALVNHVVLIWTVGRHTYGIGFHTVDGVPQALRLDRALARGIRLVGA